MQKVLIAGTFDHLHPGHEFVLREASQRGELFVIIARDATVERIKGRLPDDTEEIRKAAVETIVPKAHVVLGHSTDFLIPVRDIAPDLLLLGYDQKLPPHITEESLHCRIERLPAFEPERYKSSLMRGSS